MASGNSAKEKPSPRRINNDPAAALAAEMILQKPDETTAPELVGLWQRLPPS